jgi:hypothetical protein
LNLEGSSHHVVSKQPAGTHAPNSQGYTRIRPRPRPARARTTRREHPQSPPPSPHPLSCTQNVRDPPSPNPSKTKRPSTRLAKISTTQEWTPGCLTPNYIDTHEARRAATIRADIDALLPPPPDLAGQARLPR